MTEHDRPRPEQEPPAPYQRTARFPGERPAWRTYARLQEPIFHTPDCDLSVYRLQLNRVYHVAVLGETPPEALERWISRLLAHGEPATLPKDVLSALARRRAEATAHNRWTERHFRGHEEQ